MARRGITDLPLARHVLRRWFRLSDLGIVTLRLENRLNLLEKRVAAVEGRQPLAPESPSLPE